MIPMERRASWRERVPGRPFWLYFVAALFFNFGFAAYFFLYNVYLAQIGFNEARIGRIVAAMSLGTVAGTLPVGYAASRFGIRRTLCFALPLAAGAGMLRAMMPSYPSQIFLGLLIGTTLCAWGVCLGPSVARLTSERTRPMAFSFMFSSGIAMAGVGSVAAGHFPALLQRVHVAGDGVRLTLMLSSASVLAALLPLLMLDLGPAESAPPVLQRPNAFLRRFLVGVALWGFVAGSFTTFAAVYFTRALRVPLPELGNIFFLSQIAQCVGVLLAPMLLRRLNLGVSVMSTQLAAAAAMGLLALAHTPKHAMVLYWSYLAATYMSEPALFSLLMEQMPAAERPQASSWHMLTAALTQSITAALTGAAITAVGYRSVFVALAVVGAASGVLFRQIAAK